MQIATKDLYTWQVTYQDGWIVQEYDVANPDGRGWASIDHAAVKTLELLQGERIVHKMNVPTGATPVFFRRRIVALNPNNHTQTTTTIQCIGWKYGDPVSYPCYLFVFEDGSVLLTDDFQAV